MGLYFRRSARLARRIRLNVTRGGPSLSAGVGPIRISSRGRVTLHLARGTYWRVRS